MELLYHYNIVKCNQKYVETVRILYLDQRLHVFDCIRPVSTALSIVDSNTTLCDPQMVALCLGVIYII